MSAALDKVYNIEPIVCLGSCVQWTHVQMVCNHFATPCVKWHTSQMKRIQLYVTTSSRCASNNVTQNAQNQEKVDIEL